jgi:hypothetical protein
MSRNDAPPPATEREFGLALRILDRLQQRQDALAAENRRLARRMRLHVAAVIVVCSVLVVSVAVATTAQQQAAPAAAATAERDALLAMLSEEERKNLADFEARIHWLSSYMKHNPDFNAGAAVALFLSEVADGMAAVPKMHREMQVMNTRMAAVPAMVVEMQAINSKLAVMTGAMDSTMGRAGRMMPWMPFSP